MRNTTIACSILLAVLTGLGSAATPVLRAPRIGGNKAPPDSTGAVYQRHGEADDQYFICVHCATSAAYGARSMTAIKPAAGSVVQRLRDKQRPFCTEHSLYEDECFRFHPQLEKMKAKPPGGATP